MKQNSDIPCRYDELYAEEYIEGDLKRDHQSLSVHGDYFFCINDGEEHSIFYDSFQKSEQLKIQGYKYHHNNAQFVDIYYDKKDSFPLLLISKGNYGLINNGVYGVRIIEDDGFSPRLSK